jgi:serine/threonine protein kinase
MGTFDYMAPEQMQDAKMSDGQTDVFALGQILFEMYTGKVPAAFHGLDGLPPSIALIVDKCTQPRKENRFESVRHLRDAFLLMASGQSVADAADKLKVLTGAIVTERVATKSQVAELQELIPQCQDEPGVLHEIATQLPESAIRELYQRDSGVTLLLFRTFCEVSMGQGWPFGYTDHIGSTCLRFANATGNVEVKSLAISTALSVGIAHNRFVVMQTAANLIDSFSGNDEAAAVRRAIEKTGSKLVDIEDRINTKKLHPILRDLLEKEKRNSD